MTTREIVSAAPMKLSSARMDSQVSAAPQGTTEVAIVKMLLDVGFQHKRIAALFDCNQGRIAEISNGSSGANVSYGFLVQERGK